MDNLDYVAILRGIVRRRKLLVVAIFLGLAVPLLTYLHLTRPTVYVSTATISIESSPLDHLPFFRDLPRRNNLSAYRVLLNSRSLGDEVLESLPKESFAELLTHSQYTDYVLLLTNLVKRWVGRPPVVLSPRQQAITELRNARMEFNTLRDAPDVLNIQASASNPRVAMDLVNTHIQVLLRRTRGRSLEDTQELREFLEVQSRQVKENLAQGEEALVKFEQKRGRIRFTAQTELDLVRLSQTEGALAEAQASREVLAARIAALGQRLGHGKSSDEGATSAPGAEDLAPLTALKAAQERLARLEAKLAGLRERYTEEHPLVQATREEVVREQARMAHLARELPLAPSPRDVRKPQPMPTAALDRTEMHRQLAALEMEDASLQTKVDSLRLQAERLRGTLRNLSQEEKEFSSYRQTVEMNRSLLTALSDKLMTLRIREQGESSVTRIIDPASFPAQSTQSKTQKLMLMVLAMAGGIAFAVAFSIEFWRLPVDIESDVQKTTGLLVLGSVGIFENPTDGRKGHRRPQLSSLPILLPGSSVPVGIHMELYRAIRAVVEIERLKSPFRSILVTSPGPSEGKSSTVLNLAHAFQEFGRRVLIVDTDLRRPSIHRALSLPNKTGIVDLLRGTASFDQACQSLPSGVTVIPGQVAPEDAASLLASSRAKDLLKEANDRFDLILVDSAPVLAVPDNLLLLTTLDRAIIVVKASATSKRDLQKTQNSLQQMNANILGVILNQANRRDVHYYHPRYSKYYSSNDGKGAQTTSKKSRLLSWRRKH